MPEDPAYIPMLNDVGEPTTVHPDDVQAALAQGYEHDTPEKAQLREAGEHPIRAGVESAISSAIPMGPSLIEGVGGPSKAQQRLDIEANPKASGLGSFVGSGAQIAAVTAATAGLGDVAEGAVGIGKAAKFLKAAAVMSASNVAQEISEEDLGDKGFNGDALAIAAGTGAIWGIGGEGLLAAGEHIMPKVLSKAGEGLDKLQDKALGLFAKASSAVSGIEEETISAAGKQAIAEGGAPRTKLARELTDKQAATDLAGTLNEVEDNIQSVHSQLWDKDRPAEIAAKAIPGAEGQKMAIRGMQDVIETKVQPILDRLDQDIADGKIKYDQPVNTLRRGLDDYAEAVTKSALNDGSSAEVYEATRQLRETLGNTQRYGKSLNGLNPDVREAIVRVGEAIHPLQDAMSNAEIFGKDIAERNQALNQSYNELKTARTNLYGSLGFSELGEHGRPIVQADPSKFLTLLRGEGSEKAAAQLRVKETGEYLSQYLDKARNYVNEAATTAKNASAAPPDIDQLRALLERVQAQRESGVAGAANTALESLRARERPPPGGLATGIGVLGSVAHAAGVPTGVLAPVGAIVGGYKALKYPLETIEAYARISSAAAKVSKGIKSGVSKFLGNPMTRAEAQAVTGSAFGALHGGVTLAAGRMAKGNTPVERRSQEITALSNSPQLQMSTLAKNTSRIATAAPATTVSMNQTAIRGLGVLAAAVNKDPAPSPLEANQPYQPNGDEIATFERKYHAVTKPMACLFDGLQSGTLTPDEITTIGAVYPSFLQEVKNQVMENLADHPKRELSFPQKMGIQLLFADQGTTVDPELAPAHVGWLANVYQNGRQGPPPMGQEKKPNQAGMDKMNLAQAEMTPLQHAQERRS